VKLLAGTGHPLPVLSEPCLFRIPVILRPCAEGETGVVLSRYDGVAGYDWIAIPLIRTSMRLTNRTPSRCRPTQGWLLSSGDQYRRDYLESLAPIAPTAGYPRATGMR